MLLNRIFDFLLLQIDKLGHDIPSVINIAVILLWIFIIKHFKIPYRVSLMISLFLISLSAGALILTFTVLAGVIGEYAFIFLSVGAVQALFEKQTPG